MTHSLRSDSRAYSLILCALLVLMSGCSSGPQVRDQDSRENYELAKARLANQGPKVRGPEEIAPGYELKLSSNDDPNLNGKYRVEFEGRLKLPYDVKLEADGLTVDQLRKEIAQAYSKYFKTSPNIGLSITEERYWIDVRGLVEKPGRFLVKRSTSLDEAIALAGGLQKTATVRYVKIQQAKFATTIKLSEYYAGSPQDRVPPWRGGDILFFQTERGENPLPGESEGAYVQVMGEVRTPGEYRFVRDADFYYYLVKAGGPTDRADLRGIQLVRETVEGKKMIGFSLDNPKDLPSIQSGDIILLVGDKPTPFERTVPLISGLVAILNTALLILLVF